MKLVEIRIKGKIDKDWTDWFGNLAVSHSSKGDSILTGGVKDQAELRGVLTRLADLNLELISVNSKFEENTNIPERG
jgi:hypothetical protein